MTKLLHTLVFVSDMERSVAFYRDVLGWPLTCQSPERSELAAGGATLILHYANKPSGAAAVQGEIAGRCQLSDALSARRDRNEAVRCRSETTQTKRCVVG